MPRAVVLEADPAHRLALGQFFEQEGYRPLLVDNLAGLRHVKEEAVGIAVIGEWVERPGERNPIEWIRSDPKGQQLFVLQLTSPEGGWNGHPQADLHLRKPYQHRQLSRILRLAPQYLSLAGSRSKRPIPISTAQGPLAVPPTGSLTVVPFYHLLVEIWTAAVSGALSLKSGNTMRRIDFINGLPVRVHSNLVTEQLVRFLLRLNVITPDTYRQILPQAQNAEENPEASLIDTGLINKAHLLEARSALSREILMQCFRWTDATYVFDGEFLPAPQSCLTDLDPLTCCIAWLSDPAASDIYQLKLSRLLGYGLKATADLHDCRHQIAGLLKKLPARVQAFDEAVSVSSLWNGAADEEEIKRILVCLVDFRLAKPIPLRKKEANKAEPPTVTAVGRKFERIRQIVAEDRTRVDRATSPHAILGLADGASDAEVNARYQRYCRFYKPENFERIGDTDLLKDAQSLLEAFRKAASDILGEVPSQLPAPLQGIPLVSEVQARQEETILAEVFFDDSMTYLKVGDFKEAQEHLRRSSRLVPDNPRFLAQLGWVTYLAGKGNMLEVAKAKQTLLNALKLDPNNDRALHYLGCLYEDERQFDKAIECWTRAIKINPANQEAQSALRRINTH
ncbi:MAG: tetratricopeptide repeat protein [Bradymonadales bacterium]|nr:tetratricopeptide repeat protein [Bradymonadales bacterium]